LDEEYHKKGDNCGAGIDDQQVLAVWLSKGAPRVGRPTRRRCGLFRSVFSNRCLSPLSPSLRVPLARR
jgi:hypothetical protein